eukprot:7744743-Alexandrium_andersonii.AAC.1
MLSLRGAGAKEARRRYFTVKGATIQCRTRFGVKNVPVTYQYKHMGGMITADADPAIEVPFRISAAKNSAAPIRKT